MSPVSDWTKPHAEQLRAQITCRNNMRNPAHAWKLWGLRKL